MKISSEEKEQREYNIEYIHKVLFKVGPQNVVEPPISQYKEGNKLHKSMFTG